MEFNQGQGKAGGQYVSLGVDPGSWVNTPLMSCHLQHQIVSRNQEIHLGPIFLILWECHFKRSTSRQASLQRPLSSPGLCLSLYPQCSPCPSPPPTHYQAVKLRWPESIGTPYLPHPTRWLELVPLDSWQCSSLPSGSCFQWAQPGWETISVFPLYPVLPSAPASGCFVSVCFRFLN